MQLHTCISILDPWRSGLARWTSVCEAIQRSSVRSRADSIFGVLETVFCSVVVSWRPLLCIGDCVCQCSSVLETFWCIGDWVLQYSSDLKGFFGALGIVSCSVIVSWRLVWCNGDGVLQYSSVLEICHMPCGVPTELRSSHVWHHARHCTQTATHHTFVHHRHRSRHLHPHTVALGWTPSRWSTLTQGLWAGQLDAGLLTFRFPCLSTQQWNAVSTRRQHCSAG